MTKKQPANVAAIVPLPKWIEARAKQRIRLSDHKVIPYLNSTTQGLYRGTELHYRGRGA